MEYKQPVIKSFCQRCEHFCSKTYPQSSVCALHPYGPEGETCADWLPMARPEHVVEPEQEIEIVWANPDRRWWQKRINRLRLRGGRR